MQQRVRDTPNLTHRDIAPGEANRSKGREPLEMTFKTKEKLSPPRRTVGPRPRSIERNTQHRSSDAMLGHRADDMRMVVLHPDVVCRASRKRVPRREVSRMQVVREHVGTNRKDRLHPLDGLFKERQRRDRFEVADVGAEVCRVARCNAEGVLEMCAAREYGLIDRTP